MLRFAAILLAFALIIPLFAYSFVADFTFEAAKNVFFGIVVLAIVVFIVDSFRSRATV